MGFTSKELQIKWTGRQDKKTKLLFSRALKQEALLRSSWSNHSLQGAQGSFRVKFRHRDPCLTFLYWDCCTLSHLWKIKE